MLEISLILAFLCASCTRGVSLKYLERGSTGIVECTAMVDNGYSADDTEAIYWYFSPKGSSDSPRSIITYFHGVTTPQGINPEKYKIQNTSLVISKVTQAAEGTYNYEYFPWYKDVIEGLVEVDETVSCKAKWPKVYGCFGGQPTCELEIKPLTTDLDLTCSVEHAKPAVNISWFGWSPTINTWEEIYVIPQFQPVFCNASEKDCFYFNNTINSKATIKPSLESNHSTFKCVAHNGKLDDFIVNVTKTGSDTLKATEVTRSITVGSEETCSLGFSTAYLFGLITGMMVMLVIFCCYLKWKKRQINKQGVRENHSQLEVVALK